MEHIIGMDFGNFNTYTCIIEDIDPGTHMGGMVRDLLPQRYVDGIPSVYFYSKKMGTVLYGGDAVSLRAVPEQNRLRYLKRHLGESIDLDGVNTSYDKAITEVTQYCLRIANQRLDHDLQFTTNLVSLSYPATFTCAQRERLVELIEKATLEDGRHIEVRGTVAEPAAAALDYLAVEEKSGQDRTVLTYDLGGGTFDLGLVSVYPRGRKRSDGSLFYYDIINSRGIGDLGGAEFDTIIYDYVLAKLPQVADPRLKARIRNASEKAKVELSNIEETCVSIEINGEYEDITIRRDWFEMASKHLIDKTINATREMLYNNQNQKPDYILLTGGASQMPMVKREVEKAFPDYKGRIKIYKPSMAIAYGAARYGAKEISAIPVEPNKMKESIIEKHLDYDIGIRFYDPAFLEKNEKKHFVSTYLKAGTTLPCETEYMGSKTICETSASRFSVMEAIKTNPNNHALEDYKRIMCVDLDFKKTVPKGYCSETKLVVDGRGILRIEAREKDNPSNAIGSIVQLQNLS